jgi:hypothetical protein
MKSIIKNCIIVVRDDRHFRTLLKLKKQEAEGFLMKPARMSYRTNDI